MYLERKKLYEDIEKSRHTKVIAYATGHRSGMETQIAPDAVDIIGDHLDNIGNTRKISLILYTLGGSTLAAWNIINLLREYCKELEIIVPNKCRSAGTLMCLGADNIIMTKHATLGPIDPSITSPLGPVIPNTNPPQRVAISVESVKGYFDLLKNEVGISDPEVLGEAYKKLSDTVNPLVLGDIYRTKCQIKMLARKLMSMHKLDDLYAENIVSFLCSDSGSHDYTINRTEAKSLGLKINTPSDKMNFSLKYWYNDIIDEMKIKEAINPDKELNGEQKANFSYTRGIIESVKMRHAYITEGCYNVTFNQNTNQKHLTTLKTYEGWKNFDNQ